MERFKFAEANGYLATPDGSILRFDYFGMKNAVKNSPDPVNAEDYVTRIR